MAYKLMSLFDGSGGFPLAGMLCGVEPVAASEVEPYPIAVTRSRFPGMKHLGDISKINGAEIEPVDVITFGSPCQDLSVAGKRAGIKHEATGDDETTRSGLFMEAVRIIKEMREATNGVYPAVVLWENVPGAFSSNRGEDFRVVLEELIKIAEPTAVMPPVPAKGGWPYADSYTGDGWSLAYRVFDAQYWGVPQRRRRIHLIVDFRGLCARKILFEREGLRGYFETGRTPWQSLAGDAASCVGADDREGEGNCLTPWDVQSRRIFGVDGPWPALYGGEGGGHGYVCYTEGVIAVDQGGGKSGANFHHDLSPTLTCTHGGEPAVAYTCIHEDYEVVCCIDGDKIGKSERCGGSGLGIRPGDKMYTLTAKDTGTHAVCYAETYQKTTGPLMANSHPGSYSGQDAYTDMFVVGKECAGIDCRNMNEYPELYPTLQAKPNGGQSLNFSGAVRVRYIVRRLTPVECARLQGFADTWGIPDQKDDFTDEEYRFWLDVRNTHAEINGRAVKEYTKEQMLKWYNKLRTDSAEYKMWGNGIALPPALYCMQGIVDALEEENK